MNNMTDIFNTKRDQAALVTLSASLEAGIIHNADYNDLKYSINRALEAAWNTFVTQPYLAVDYDKRQTIYGPVVVDNLYCGSGPQIHNLKSVLKRIAKVEKADPECDLLPKAIELCDAIEPIINDMNTLKGMVVKGRKPSTEPRKTPERTLENTGTCGICGHNVKMNNGKLVAHGFTLTWGSRNGNCFGVGYEPHEVSKKAVVAFLQDLTVELARIERAQLTLDNNVLSEAKINEARRTLDYQKRNIDGYIKHFEKSAREWVAKLLPGKVQSNA